MKALLEQSEAPFRSRHRIRATTGEIRNVVVIGEAVTDASPSIVATQGLYVDIARVVDDAIRREIGDELHAIVADRATIEQAEGTLIAVYDLDAQATFELLVPAASTTPADRMTG